MILYRSSTQRQSWIRAVDVPVQKPLHFAHRLRNKKDLNQIVCIQDYFRNKAAHPYLLDLGAAQQCQQAVRKCLREFLQSYRGGRASGPASGPG